MSAIGMTLLLVSLVGLFGISAFRRGKLLLVGAPSWEPRTDRWLERLEQVWTFAILQKKMRYYPVAGAAHLAIFAGFGVLLLRTLVLWGRGFDPAFNLWVLGPTTTLGQLYGFLKDTFALLVLAGVLVFVYYRVIRPQKRMTLSGEGLVILGIIATMMLADMSYDGAALVINARYDEFCAGDALGPLCDRARLIRAPLGEAEAIAFHPFGEPAASLIALCLARADLSLLVPVATFGFWIHSSLVLVFLNILPYSKHFHIITAIPNVFLSDLTAKGRLRPMAPTTELLLERVEKASEASDPEAFRIGYSKIEHFTWKDLLDLYTCTECGRCTDNCPAAKTGKKLSPKQLTLDLRSELHALQSAVLKPPAEGALGKEPLVPASIDPDVLWACTTCRACEEQCPVGITYVDKIVQMRRNLVMMRGEFPTQLTKPFEGMETNGNPWNLSRLDRGSWTEGLAVKRMAEHPSAPVLYWVGCAVSYDERAKKIARATAELLLAAGVDFAILAEEESCTGDPARRAGNEYLFSMLAEANVQTLRGYQDQGGVRTIITTCPHCFNTLKNEYPDFGARSKWSITPTSCSASWRRSVSSRPSRWRRRSLTTTRVT